MEFKLVFDTWFVPPRAHAWVLWKWVFFRHTKDKVSVRLYRHELQHCYQIERLGRFKFYAKYLWQWIRNGYWNHPFEKEARDFQDQPLTPKEHNWWMKGIVKLGD